MNHPIFCIIHCRVSTGRQAREGESLETQAQVCRGIADRHGWTLAHEPWLEAHTGSANSRPVFQNVLAFLDANPGKVKYYVFRSIDRFTRGGVDLYTQMRRDLLARGVELVDSMGVIQRAKNTLDHVGFQYDWSQDDPSEISQLVIATTAKTEKTVILTRLIGQEIALAQKGYRVRQSADGYLNECVYVDGKRRHIQVADPDRARFFAVMFELRAAHELNDRQIVDRVNAMGYRRRTFKRWNADKTQILGIGGGGLLTVARFQEIIRNPIYCGVVWEKWTHWKPVRAPYAGLVSIATYNAANRGVRYIDETGENLTLLRDYRPEKDVRSLNRNNPDYPFKNVVICPECRKPFRGSAARGQSGQRYPAYHCARAHKRIGIPKADFEKIVHAYLGHLKFASKRGPIAAQAVRKHFHSRGQELGETASAIARATKHLELQRDEAVRAFLASSSAAMRRALEEKVEQLDTQIGRSIEEHGRVEISDDDLNEFLADVQKILEHPGILAENPTNMQVQRRNFEMVFGALPTIAELGFGTAKLSPIFRLCSDLEDEDSGLAALRGLDWNQIEEAVRRWKEVAAPTAKKARPASSTFIPPNEDQPSGAQHHRSIS